MTIHGIARALRASLACATLLGACAGAFASENDSHCVSVQNRTLVNRCSFPVDVGFCVENPRQTKNFFDSSEAFRCPNGGLSTLSPGRGEGNILNGRVQWWACSTAHRGKGRWRYEAGAGYRGRCA